MSSSADADVFASEEDLTKRSLFLVESAKKSVEEASGASNLAQMVAMNVRMVSGMMGELARGMENVVTNTDESHNQIEQIQTETTKTRECLKALTKTVEDIASSASSVRGVAGRTNMLALNATIEAARAGDHGRGFAVVAGEVKALAKQTAETTSDIDAQLAAIRLAALKSFEVLGAGQRRFRSNLREIECSLDRGASTERKFYRNEHVRK